MRKLIVFNNVTLDGYFTDKNGDMSWAHKSDEEYNAFVRENSQGGGEFLLGRVTYEMMASFWPTPMAQEMMPVVAKAMNNSPKVVFSKSLTTVSWSNTKVVNGDLATEVRKMKSESGKPIVIFGSGTIVSQLAQAGLIDEYQIVLHPIALGKGRTMFEGLKEKLPLKLIKSRTFANGSTFLCYDPA